MRGKLYTSNASSTWQDIGIYAIGLPEEWPLGYSANASFGYDNVTLGRPGDGSPGVDHQVIEGFAAKDFFVGMFGLSPHAINLTDINNPQPSLLSTLSAQNKIPSSSWAYSAGSYNVRPVSFGSLTLGGYDAARFMPNNMTFPFSPDTSRDLIVGIQTIISNTSTTPLLSGGIYAFIDSTVPHIWLPVEVCQAFETVFGLVYNETAERYYVNDTSHQTLLDQNPSITFKLGPAAIGGPSVEIDMPYSSLHLSASPSFPNVNDSARTFPLRQAVNDSQITLGRAFLQDAYVIADYERLNFSVSQVIHPNTSYTQELVSIRRPGEVSPARPAEQKSGLSTGAKAGIIVGVCVAAAVLISALTWYLVRYRKRHGSGMAQSTSPGIDESGSTEVASNGAAFEMPPNDIKELTSEVKPKPELLGIPIRVELADSRPDSVHEMPAPTPEMEDSSPWIRSTRSSQTHVSASPTTL